MDASRIEALHSLACAFRAAILRCEPSELPITLHNFPHGACGDAALLLAKYLDQAGLGPSRYVCGWRTPANETEQPRSHAWLQQGDTIIDITADQFSEGKDAVIVTTDNAWHKGFTGESEYEVDFERYDERTRTTLSAAYRKVLERLS